jgi:hypothetical protein
MGYIAIVFTVCALTHPDRCQEERLAFAWHGSLRSCVMSAQPYLAQWIGEHPQWSIQRYHCEYPPKSRKA